MPKNKVFDLSFSEQCKEKELITFKVKPNSELTIKFCVRIFHVLEISK
jgi:hypothetical protein